MHNHACVIFCTYSNKNGVHRLYESKMRETLERLKNNEHGGARGPLSRSQRSSFVF